ncbi:MAG TPA: pitrilysin family protein [Vicinamibacterales bacterium]|jgi:zinc protease|nr:pitrilysin family protein [Vicinamibacterales bacterium]
MSPGDVIQSSSLRRATLDNGLKVLVQEIHTAPLASVWCWYRVGSKDEPPGLTGASHWVEHMNFKGTAHIPRERMKGIVERFGGSWNGYTWIDQTTYFETVSNVALDEMLFLEAERLASCTYDPAEVEAERTVIISELQGGENDPDQLLEIEVTAAAFRAHPYRHPTIGWRSDLETMTRDDLYGHYRRYYRPNNASLVVVGGVDADETLRLVERRFGALEPGVDPKRIRVTEPAQLGERRVKIEKEGTTAYLKCAWRAPAVTDADFLPMLVLDAVLTGAKGLNIWCSFRGAAPQRKARLYRALVETGLASSVGGSLLPTEQPFLYGVSATANEGVSLSEVEGALAAEIARVVRDGVTAEEVERAKRQLRARTVFENDSVTNIAHQLGYFQTVATIEVLSSVGLDLAAVTEDQVADVARRRLTASARTVGWFQPVAS